jgi:hypothetical protein
MGEKIIILNWILNNYALHMSAADTRNPARAAMKVGKLSEGEEEEEEEREEEGGCGIEPKTVG